MNTFFQSKLFRWTALVTLLLLVLTLYGCGTTYVPQEIKTQPCGQNLQEDYLKACSKLENLKGQPTPLDMVNRSAELRKALEACAIKAKVLQDTIRACQGVKNE